jgi:hypothetical protein
MARSVSAAAVLAAAVCVVVLVRRDLELRRRLVRERATSRLTAGCLHRDLDVFRRRLDLPADSVARFDPMAVPTEGGPQ